MAVIARTILRKVELKVTLKGTFWTRASTAMDYALIASASIPAALL
jgi:hypothetical protein